MKKTLIALATLAATGAVMAQSSVTIYGVVDQAFSRVSNSDTDGNSKTQIRSSGTATNRLGFRGTEDLGGGLKAKFMVEMNLFADNPSSPFTPTLGDRGAWVSLASDNWGEVRLGRDYNNAFWTPILFSPFGTTGVGQSLIHSVRYTGTGIKSTANDANYIWNNNSIGYILPGNLGGVYGGIQYAFDEISTAGDNKGQSTNFRLGYKAGAFDVALGYDNTEGNATTADDVRSTNLGASYDLGVVKLMGVWSQDTFKDNVAGTTLGKVKGWDLGVVAPMASGRIRASYGRVEYTAAGVSAGKSSKFAVGYVHDLSKRTSIYTTVARVSNKDGAGVRADGGSGGQANKGSTGLDIGISHTF